MKGFGQCAAVRALFESRSVLILPAYAVTILCHPAFASAPASYGLPVNPTYLFAHCERWNSRNEFLHTLSSQPTAKDDHASTLEEIRVVIPVLDNDEKGDGDDGDSRIDRTSVDLEPDREGITRTLATDAGVFLTNDRGEIAFDPAVDYFGEPVIRYAFRNHGGEVSSAASVFVTVQNVNDAPVITGQTPDPLTFSEDEVFEIALGNLVVDDDDSSYPDGFSMQVLAGENYSADATRITPDPDFYGSLSVPVTVSDGDLTSEIFNLDVTIVGVNDPPIITGQLPNPLAAMEEEPVTLDFSNLAVADPDNSYPADFTMDVLPGENYSVSGNTVTPATDFQGMLSVPVTVSDGALTSNTMAVNVQVADENDAPVITGQSPLRVDEDNSITVIFANLQVTDNDNTYPEGFSILVSPGENYSVSGTTVTPAANYHGVLSIPVMVNDGTSNSAPFDLVVTVDPVNDAPAITGQVELTTGEGESIVLELSHLTVNDPDNLYPDDFSLSILSGSNYSVSGNTVTPAPDFNGVLTVGVFVNDGSENSDVFYLQIHVNAVNNPPVITGQVPLNVPEDQPLTIQLDDVIVSDPDNDYPTGFTLTVLSGAGYALVDNTITPAADFTGTLSVGVRVNDGQADSAPFDLQVGVTAVNDAPEITGQSPLTTPEDQPVSVRMEDLIVADPDNAYPQGFALSVFPGTNYSVIGTTITPQADFHGALVVPVQVNDGELSSNIHELSIAVTAVNDPPLITGQTPLSTAEDTPVTLALSHLTVVDPDNHYPEGFSLLVHDGVNYTVEGTTVVPVADYSGTLNVGVTVNDGTNDSPLFTFQIQVGDANDPPTITGQADLQTNEEQSLALLLSHLVVYDPDDPYPGDFTLLISPGENFVVSGNVITPATDFAGTLTVPVRVNDGVNNSATYGLQVQVLQINDAPVFDAIPNQQMMENAPPRTVGITNISKGPGESGQQLTLVARSGNTAIVPDPVVSYNGTGPTATLRIAPAANASGVVVITVTAIDNGLATSPHRNAYSAVFQVEVMEINAAPTLTPISDRSVAEDAPQQDIPLTGITAGPGESQQLAVTVSASVPHLFEVLNVVYASPSQQGVLQVKPAANAAGSSRITVTVTDNGSGISPNANTISRSFTFAVASSNDPPVFTSVPAGLAAVGEEYLYTVEYTDVESRSLPVTLVERPSWLVVTPLGDGRARLAGTPSAAGTFQVKVRVSDGGVYADQAYALLVNRRPEAKPFSADISEDEEFPFQTSSFSQRYSDADGHLLRAIGITQLPGAGTLLRGGSAVAAGDTIPFDQLSSVVYKPDQDYAGTDAFYWKVFDGYHFSRQSAAVDFTISPVNDAPLVVLEGDTLKFEVNGEPSLLTTAFRVEDPDDDSLSFAELTINTENFQPGSDRLIYDLPSVVTGAFDLQTGRLRLTGRAPVEEYTRAIQSIRYNYLNTVDPTLGMKRVAFTVHDGETGSANKERLLLLQYTFIELEIPTGFTPNGDQANDTWIITRPGGLDQLQQAVIRVFDRRGVEVFKTTGFDTPWDGKMNGELLPADSYFFTIDLGLKTKKIYRGVVTILR